MIFAKLAACSLGMLVVCGCSKKPDMCAGKDGNAPLARVGHAVITAADLERKAGDVPAEYQKYVSTPEGKKQFLQILLRERVILSAAQDSDIPRSGVYKTETARMKKELDDRYADFQEYLLTRMWLDSLRSKNIISVSEREIQEYYRKYPFEVSISHILLSNPDEASALVKSLRASPHSFQSAAKSRSLDRETAANGGRGPAFIAGEFLPELEGPAIGMRSGEVQGVIKSRSGYHIIRKNGENKLSYAAARDRIGRILEKKKLDDYLNSLQSKYPVEVLDESYKYQ